MLNYLEYKKIHDMKEKGINQNRVVKQLGLTSYSVRQVWNMSEDQYFGVEVLAHEKLDKFKEYIVELLRNYPGIRDATIQDKLKENFKDYDVHRSSFYRYMKKLREIEGFNLTNKRQFQAVEETAPGYESQVDLGQAKLKDMYGKMVKVFFFCMILSYSRQKFVYFSVDPFTTKHFILAHEKAFKYFGGRTEMIMYDQDRLLLVSENAGNPVYTKAFEDYRQKVNFTVYLCHKQDPDTKGKIENCVKFVKTSFLDSREYCGIDSLNSDCLAWLDRTGNGMVNGNTKRIPREMFEIEAPKLIKTTAQNIMLYEQKIVCLSDINTLTHKKNRYSVPAGKYPKGTRFRLEEVGEDLVIREAASGDVAIIHKLSDGIGKVVKHPDRKEAPEIIQRTKELFRQNEVVNLFVDKVAEAKPRYIKQQCNLLKKMLKEYDKTELVKAVEKCSKANKFCATEVLAELVAVSGLKRAEKVMPSKTKPFYKKKAEGLAKYSALLED